MSQLELPPDLPRYCPRRPLPPYRYVPGRGLPHPINDPEGHSYTESPDEPSEPWALEDWPRLEEWLFGVDLFNHAYWWESHEAFEGLWQVAPTPEATELLQGLIQLAVALLKAYQGQSRAARSLLGRARERFERIDIPMLLGLDRAELLRRSEEYLAGRAKGLVGRPPTITLHLP